MADNNYFSDNYIYSGKSKIPTTIHRKSYNKEVLESEDIQTDIESFSSKVREDCINWFRIEGLIDSLNISRLMAEFGLDVIDSRDVLTPDSVVKIDKNDNRILTVLNDCNFTFNELVISEHICIIVVGNVVLTFTENKDTVFDNVDTSLNLNTMKIRSQGSGVLLAFLLNSIMASMIETTVKVEDMLEKLEEVLLANQYTPADAGSKIQECHSAYLIIRKNSFPLKEEVNKFLESNCEIIDESSLPLFRSISYQLEFVIQTSSNSKDILSSLVQLYVSNNELRTNDIMKRLTIVSTLFIPITFIVGLWGMNFAIMPELKWDFGYLVAWLILLITGIGTWLFMKKKKWFK